MRAAEEPVQAQERAQGYVVNLHAISAHTVRTCILETLRNNTNLLKNILKADPRPLHLIHFEVAVKILRHAVVFVFLLVEFEKLWEIVAKPVIPVFGTGNYAGMNYAVIFSW